MKKTRNAFTTNSKNEVTDAAIDTVVSCPVRPSFRISQVQGMFDLPEAKPQAFVLRWNCRATTSRGRSVSSWVLPAAARRPSPTPPSAHCPDERGGRASVPWSIASAAARSRKSPPCSPPSASVHRPHGSSLTASSPRRAFRCDLARALLDRQCRGSSTNSPAWSIARSPAHPRRGGGPGRAANVVRASRLRIKAVRRRHLSLRRGPVAGARLGAGHGNRPFDARLSSAVRIAAFSPSHHCRRLAHVSRVITI